MPSRRDFLLSSAAAVLATACRARGALVPGNSIQPGRWDVLIRGGHVLDGSGAAGFDADVAILDGRIAAIGEAARGGSAALEVDARGRVVAPGFIDIHSHADGSLADDPRAESVIRQGVTTIVVGQDGSSRGVARAGGEGPDAPSMARVLDGFDRLSPAVNVASMVGLGSVRRAVIGDADRPATSAELAEMTAIVERALAGGACGASSGLEYIPGAFATRDELIALCRPLASRGLCYATHMRNEDDRLLEAIDEAIAVARGAGCPLQISHLKTQGPRNWGKLDDAFARIEGAKRGGLDVAFDRYPYIAYSTSLSNLFPAWSREGGTEAFLARLADPVQAPRIEAEARAKVESIGGWDNVMVTSAGGSADKAAEGARLGAYATARGTDPYAAALALLRAGRGSIGMVGFAMSEDNTARILAHPLGMVCSDGGGFAIDGPARRGHPHPRGLGTFPRVLGHYVRERRAMTLEQAVHKMTAFPASRAGLRDRGRLAVGLVADVVVFDPVTVTDRATFTDPFRYPAGVEAVFVNGVAALLYEERGEQRTGRALGRES
ncbi:MAG TPA: D-aminoacylase [Gemmatimonadaceae bacterium]|nr:D-aminoacylase [Gemmatimonadaceae bacterium]